MENDKIAAGESDPSEYNEVVTTKDTETIDYFLSHVIHARMGMAHTGEGINVITQALHAEDGSLPQGLTVQNTYTELHDGSKNVTMVVRNNMAYPQTLRKKTPVGKGSHSHMGTRYPYADLHNGGIRGGTGPPHTKADCEARAGKVV